MSAATSWTAVCRAEDLPAGHARGFVLGEDPREEIIVTREGDRVRAFRNRCPHQGTALNLLPDHFLDTAGEFLVCSTHGALFRPTDGYCVAGPCQGDELSRLDVRIAEGRVEVSRARLL